MGTRIWKGSISQFCLSFTQYNFKLKTRDWWFIFYRVVECILFFSAKCNFHIENIWMWDGAVFRCQFVKQSIWAATIYYHHHWTLFEIWILFFINTINRFCNDATDFFLQYDSIEIELLLMWLVNMWIIQINK